MPSAAAIARDRWGVDTGERAAVPDMAELSDDDLDRLSRFIREEWPAHQQAESTDRKATHQWLADNAAGLQRNSDAIRHLADTIDAMSGEYEETKTKADALVDSIGPLLTKVDQMHDYLQPKIELDKAKRIVAKEIDDQLGTWKKWLSRAWVVIRPLILIGALTWAFYVKWRYDVDTIPDLFE